MAQLCDGQRTLYTRLIVLHQAVVGHGTEVDVAVATTIGSRVSAIAVSAAHGAHESHGKAGNGIHHGVTTTVHMCRGVVRASAE